MKLRHVGSNMIEFDLENGTVVLFSYDTPVAAYVPERGYIRTETYYSVTTSRHINKWLGPMVADETVPQSVIDALVA